MKKNPVVKRAILVLLVVTMLFSTTGLSGCANTNTPQNTAASFFDSIQQNAYPRIYRLLTQESRDAMSLQDLIARYEEIYSTLNITSSQCTLKDIQPADGGHMIAHYTFAFQSGKLGDVSLDMEMEMEKQGRHWLILWKPSLILPQMEDGDKVRLIAIPGQRGEIFDVNGELLAKDDYALSVYANLAQIQDADTVARLAAPLLKMTEEDIRKKLEPKDEASPDATATPTPSPTATPDPAQESTPKDKLVVIKAFPRDGLSQDVQNQILDIPGLGIDTGFMTPIRSYPYGQLLSHVLGYTSVVSAEDLAKPENSSLSKDALIGKSGLELAYENDLRGSTGYELDIVDSEGEKKAVLVNVPKTDGRDLRLSIDIDLQQRAELSLMQNLTSEMAGTVICLDPTTGYVQTIANYPSFDPNIFSFPISSEDWNSLNDSKNMYPLYNRATLGLYPPGSTFKPFTAVMALRDKKLTPSFVFTEPIHDNLWTPSVEGWVYPPIKRVTTTPDPLNLQNAIIYSDNIYFAYAAMQVGASRFVDFCKNWGFGTPFTSDLPVATSQICNSFPMNSMRLLADSGYGQGELLVSPLQMASLFGSLDNKGDVMLPRIVEKECVTNGAHYDTVTTNPPEVLQEGAIQQDELNTLLPLLRKVVSQGTAQRVNVAGLDICGKTGTAEIGNDKTREIAWFIGFATSDKMSRLVCVMLEIPAGQGEVRFDIAKDMFTDPVVPGANDTHNSDQNATTNTQNKTTPTTTQTGGSHNTTPQSTAPKATSTKPKASPTKPKASPTKSR